MQEDSFVLSDTDPDEGSDDEYSLDGSDKYSVNTFEESEESEQEEDEEEEGTLLDMLDKPYTGRKEEATEEPTTVAGKNGIPKQHLGKERRDKKGSCGDSTTLFCSGPFEDPDSDHSSDPASVANNDSLESLARPKKYITDNLRRPCTRSIRTATPKLATDLARNEESKKQPNRKPKRPSKLNFDGWMPHRYARVSTPGTNPLKQKAYLISRRKFFEMEKELTGDKGRKLTRRDGQCLRGIKLWNFHVQNIAVGPDGSVSLLGRLDKEKEPSIWTRTVLAEAWGRERADQLLSFYLKQAGARGLPNNKRRKIQQGGNDSISKWDKEFKKLMVRVGGGEQ
ncbi:hypothetical protein BFJ63_vAg18993 [Fusarium oxysporum f. sp. narcissi]|uniref:Uncharacterized protein n=1 Tax=Fusarium oxysporum f. sp. narcissi TaxID=451672 RepID=A0A4Q2V1B9_FUSOX|nr:hypothetical protein BFJ63_vAg18993 [Fusarium oxysporum f. sp. narcissi]